jgi:predicted nucleic acid-binding protein
MYLLDACALIAFLNDEPGAGMVADLLTQAEQGTIRLSISGIQALEVYYDRIYVKGREYADIFLERLYNSAVEVISPLSHADIREAGRLKTSYHISLADSIVCAVALGISAIVVTCDHSEMEAVERIESISFLWIR